MNTIPFDKSNKLIEIPTTDLILDLSTVNGDSIKIPKGVISWSKYSPDQILVNVKCANFNNFINTTATRFPSFLSRYIRDIKAYNRKVYNQEGLLHYKDRFGFTFEVLLTVKSDGYCVVNTTGTKITRKTWDNQPINPLFNNVYSDFHICWGSAATIPSETDAFKVAVDCTEYFFSLAMNDDNCYISKTVRFIHPKYHILAVLERRIPQIQEFYPKITREEWSSLLTNISTFLDKKELTPLNYLLLASMFDIDISLFDLK